jgi:hypothetical protein
MDFGRAFSFVFEDPDWLKKVAIAGLVMLIPVIGQLVVLGWALNITKRVMDGSSSVLPDIDFGGDLGRGFMAFVIGFVYSLPVTLVSSFIGIVNNVLGMNMDSDSSAIAILIMILFSCLGIFSFLYSIFITLLLPAAYTRYLEENSLGAAFNLSKVFAMVKANIGAYFIVLLGMICASLVSSLGLIACLIGVIFTSAYATAVIGHLYGQAYVDTKRKLGEAAI